MGVFRMLLLIFFMERLDGLGALAVLAVEQAGRIFLQFLPDRIDTRLCPVLQLFVKCLRFSSYSFSRTSFCVSACVTMADAASSISVNLFTIESI